MPSLTELGTRLGTGLKREAAEAELPLPLLLGVSAVLHWGYKHTLWSPGWKPWTDGQPRHESDACTRYDPNNGPAR